MIPLEEFKKSLGPVTDTITEEKILKTRELMDRLAEILFDRWLRNRNGPKSE